MCFVSYIPLATGFLLGSNRDEHRARKTALSPRIMDNQGSKLAMPVDGNAGGTWIALRYDGVASVLLNGAFENHVREPFYQHSRGVIIPQIMESKNPNKAISTFNLYNIEPFTLVIVAAGELAEWRWDGKHLHSLPSDAAKPYCWSSVTLYNENQQAIRRKWFMDALQAGTIHDAETLLRWQATGGYGPAETDIVLKRTDGIGTVSSTVVSVVENRLEMVYEDYLSPVPQVVSFEPEKIFHEEEKYLQKGN